MHVPKTTQCLRLLCDNLPKAVSSFNFILLEPFTARTNGEPNEASRKRKRKAPTCFHYHVNAAFVFHAISAKWPLAFSGELLRPLRHLKPQKATSAETASETTNPRGTSETFAPKTTHPPRKKALTSAFTPSEIRPREGDKHRRRRREKSEGPPDAAPDAPEECTDPIRDDLRPRGVRYLPGRKREGVKIEVRRKNGALVGMAAVTQEVSARRPAGDVFGVFCATLRKKIRNGDAEAPWVPEMCRI